MDSRNILLIFKKDIMYKPIIYRLARDYNIQFNVLEAKILPQMEGRIILELKGNRPDINKGIQYMENEGVQIESLADKIQKDDERCVHCGACTAVCSVNALSIDTTTMKVQFDSEKCVVCGLCKQACPVNAMKSINIELAVNGY